MAHGSLSQFKATLERKKAREDKRRKLLKVVISILKF